MSILTDAEIVLKRNCDKIAQATNIIVNLHSDISRNNSYIEAQEKRIENFKKDVAIVKEDTKEILINIESQRKIIEDTEFLIGCNVAAGVFKHTKKDESDKKHKRKNWANNAS